MLTLYTYEAVNLRVFKGFILRRCKYVKINKTKYIYCDNCDMAKIKVNKYEDFFLLEVDEDNHIFLDTLNETNITMFKDNLDDNKIFADEIITLNQYLTEKHNRLHYNEGLNLIENIGNQLKFLENNSITIPVISKEDIIVCKKQHIISIIMINFEDYKIINDTDNIIIDLPIEKNKYFSPEYNKIIELPQQIHKRNWMFSLGLLTIDCLTNQLTHETINNLYKNIDSIGDIRDKTTKQNELIREFIFNIIRSIERTKLYHSLLRTLEYIPHKRTLLIV